MILSEFQGERTGVHKGVFVVPECFNNILGTNSHVYGTCIPEIFESNGALVLCVLCTKSGWGIYTTVLPEVIN